MAHAGNQCIRCGRRAGWIGADARLDAFPALNFLLPTPPAAAQMMGDAIYSLVTVVSAVTVLTTFWFVRKAIDEQHAYGRGKLWVLAVALISVAIAFSAFALLYFDVFGLLLADQHPSGSLFVAATALASAVTCFFGWRYIRKAAESLNSSEIRTHAQQLRVGMFLSSGVLVAALLSSAGLGFVDP